jgi:hypothetical protein
MRSRTLIVATVAFGAGIAVCAIVEMARPSSNDTASHWKAVERYRAFVRNPGNYRPDPQTGLHMTTPPPDPDPHLAALVAAGELEHVDLIFPSVPNSRAANRFWMKWAESNPDVVHATGNPTYTAFTPTGTAPLHLQLWFRGSATGAVQQLIRDLEHLPPDGG